MLHDDPDDANVGTDDDGHWEEEAHGKESHVEGNIGRSTSEIVERATHSETFENVFSPSYDWEHGPEECPGPNDDDVEE